MKIQADGLSTHGFRLELDGPAGARNVVELGPSTGLTGTYAQDDRALSLSQIAMAEARVTHAEWHPGDVTILLAAPADLGGPAIDAIIPRADDAPSGFVGTIDVKRLDAPDVGVVVGTFRLAAALRARELRYQQTESAARRATARTMKLTGAKARIGEVELSAEHLELEGVTLHVGDRGLSVEVEALRAGSVTIGVGATTVRIDELELERGLSWADGAATIPAVRLGQASVALELGESEAEEPTSTTAEPAAPAARFDLPLLDVTEGRIDVDVNVDATVPVLGVRKAVHRFRIPVVRGAINFKEVERSLAFLEDSVLDFEVEPGRLILEKDLPLVPFDNVTLVFWPLDADDQALAKRKLVRLRKLLEWQIPPELTKVDPKKKKKEPAIGLRRLGFENIAVLLSAGVSELSLGSRGRALLGARHRVEGATHEVRGVEELKITGAITHIASESPTPSALDIEARSILLSELTYEVGARALFAAAVRVGALADSKVSFDGLRPTKLVLAGQDVRLEGVRLSAPTSDA